MSKVIIHLIHSSRLDKFYASFEVNRKMYYLRGYSDTVKVDGVLGITVEDIEYEFRDELGYDVRFSYNSQRDIEVFTETARKMWEMLQEKGFTVGAD